ncbi:MAG TPA: hypothetical protein VG733_13645 [Chthoniobacteraceae bacterium]|nr:hypothetical protein [Chthoniobacteraceae bacterium]
MRKLPTLLLAACVLLAGCSTYQFITPTAQWQTLIGQLQYVSPKRSMIGETVVTRNGDADFQLDFMTGPGLPILKLRKEGNKGRAEAAFARMSWQGDANHPVGPLKSWFALHEVFSGVAAIHARDTKTTLQSQKPGEWTADVEIAGGKPVSVRITFPRSKEQFNFHFSR